MHPSIPQLSPKNLRTHSFKAFLNKRDKSETLPDQNQICKPDQTQPTKPPKTTIQPQLKPQPNMHPSAKPRPNQQTQKRHQRIPSQPIKLSKNKTRPARNFRNIKGTVSGTLHAAGRIWRGAPSTPHQARLSTLCHIYFTLQKPPEFKLSLAKCITKRHRDPARKAAMSMAHGRLQECLMPPPPGARQSPARNPTPQQSPPRHPSPHPPESAPPADFEGSAV